VLNLFNSSPVEKKLESDVFDSVDFQFKLSHLNPCAILKNGLRYGATTSGILSYTICCPELIPATKSILCIEGTLNDIVVLTQPNILICQRINR